ncbi:MAG TPA: acyl-CoA dehydrogenase family protein [Caulobacteraceae bacterium]|jgi:alkylation response protein AidB-like acyl-CoA dehydrogenase
MDFGISDDDQMILDSLTAFGAEQLRPNLRAFEVGRAVSPGIAASFGEMGFERLELPESLGGAGLGMLSRVLANIALAKADAGSAIALDRLGPALYALAAFGGVAAAAAYAGPLLETPGARAALVIEDTDRGLKAGDSINGLVAWAPSDRADLVVGLGPANCWVLDGPGKAQPVRGAALHAAGASKVTLDGKVAAAWTGAEAGAAALARVRLYVAALMIGVMEDATEFSRDYAQNRVAFGQPIAHHQGLAFLIVDLFTAVASARLLVEDAARRIDRGDDAVQAAASAFVECIEASRFVGPNGVQILGGHGFMRDYPVEKAMRDVRALGLLAGGVHRAQDEAAAHPDALAPVFEGV